MPNSLSLQSILNNTQARASANPYILAPAEPYSPYCNPCRNYNPPLAENNPCAPTATPAPFNYNPFGQPVFPVTMQPTNPFTPSPVLPILGQPTFPIVSDPRWPPSCRPPLMITPNPVPPMTQRLNPFMPIDPRPQEPCGGTSPFPLLNPTAQYVPWNNSGAAALPFQNLMASGVKSPFISATRVSAIPIVARPAPSLQGFTRPFPTAPELLYCPVPTNTGYMT